VKSALNYKERRSPERRFFNRRLKTAAYSCSRVIHQSAGEEPRPGSSSSPRQIVNNSAALAAALCWSGTKLPNEHVAPGYELPPLSFNDSKETFEPGASSRSIDEHSDDNRNEVFCKHFARIERRAGEKLSQIKVKLNPERTSQR
jgi:hypothetical protein